MLIVATGGGFVDTQIWQTALNSLLYEAVFENNLPPSETMTVQIGIQDGSHTLLYFLSDSLTIQFTSLNDAPTATILATTYAAAEHSPLSLKGTGLSISDVDANNGMTTVTLSVGEGTLFANAGTSGVAVQGDGTPSLTVTGTVAQINAFLGAGGTSTLTYRTVSGAPSANTTLSLTVSDNGNTGVGGNLSASDSATILISPINDAPSAVSLFATLSTIAETASTTTPIKIADIVVTDPDGGSSTLALIGADGALFEIVGTELFLRAGIVFDFETRSSYSVAVAVDDSSVAATPDATSALYTLLVSDVSPETMVGTTAADTLVGSSDAELIFGLGGKDTLRGEGGTDTLTGGQGRDKLTGGFDRDTFDFDSVADAGRNQTTRDIITDFKHAQHDKVDLKGMDAKLGPGNQAFHFLGDDAFDGSKGALHFRFEGANKTIVEGDVNGDRRADFQIELTGHINLVRGDFVL